MKCDFTGKTILVTGGCSGVGLSTVKAFAACGGCVIAADVLPPERAEERLAGSGSTTYVTMDVTDRQQVNAVFERYPVDILVNNAGIYPTGELLELTPEQWQQMLNTDLNSVFYCTQAAAREMRERGGGCIINITTIDAMHPSRGHAHYCAAKAGVQSLTRSCATALGKFGIRVNAVAPGLVNRPTLQRDWPEGCERFLSRAAIACIPEAEDIANACLFLAEAKAVTGIELPVDSGVLAAAPY